jgi:replication factor C large subunit
VGNARALRDLRAWAEGWGPGRPTPRLRAALLEGPPGVGKTAAALAVARERHWDVIEMNASDARNRASVESVAGRASVTHTFGPDGRFVSAREGGRTLLLMDEADCLTSRVEDAAPSGPEGPDFREFLRFRYRSVDALARAWGLGEPGRPAAFTSWEAAPLSAARGAWTRLLPAQRDLADWRDSVARTDTSDRGGLGAIARLVRETRQPLVLTANDSSSLTRYSPIFRSSVARIRFEPISEPEMRSFLRRIVLEENMRIQSAALDAVVARAQGDVRAALNDLEALAELPPGPLQVAAVGARDLPSDFLEFTGRILAQPRVYRSVEIRDRLDATPDDLLPWIEENLPRVPAVPSARLAGFERLAEAERFLARARRDRVYALWSFASELMTGGVSVALGDGSPRAELPVAFPQFLARMGRTRTSRSVRRRVLQRIGRHAHVSRSKGNEVWTPFLSRLFSDPSEGAHRPSVEALRVDLVRALALDAEDLAFWMDLTPESRDVTRLLDRARSAVGPARPAAETAAPSVPSVPRPKRASRPAGPSVASSERSQESSASGEATTERPTGRRRGQRALPDR